MRPRKSILNPNKPSYFFFVFSVIGKFTSTQDNCDEGGNRPNGPHHPHPLHVLPLHELVRGQGGHLQRVHGQVLAHIHGDLENIMKSWNQISKIYFRLRWAAVGGFLLRHSTSPLSLHTIGLKILPWKLPMKILPWEYSHENTWKCSHVNTSHNQCEWNLHQLTLQDPFQRGSRVRLGFHPLYHQEARGGGWGGGEREVRVVTAWYHGSWCLVPWCHGSWYQVPPGSWFLVGFTSIALAWPHQAWLFAKVTYSWKIYFVHLYFLKKPSFLQ